MARDLRAPLEIVKEILEGRGLERRKLSLSAKRLPPAQEHRPDHPCRYGALRVERALPRHSGSQTDLNTLQMSRATSPRDIGRGYHVITAIFGYSNLAHPKVPAILPALLDQHLNRRSVAR